MQAKANIIPHPATKMRVVLPNDFEIIGSIQTSPFPDYIQVRQGTLYRQGKRIRHESNLHISTHAILYIVEE